MRKGRNSATVYEIGQKSLLSSKKDLGEKGLSRRLRPVISSHSFIYDPLRLLPRQHVAWMSYSEAGVKRGTGPPSWIRNRGSLVPAPSLVVFLYSLQPPSNALLHGWGNGTDELVPAHHKRLPKWLKCGSYPPSSMQWYSAPQNRVTSETFPTRLDGSTPSWPHYLVCFLVISSPFPFSLTRLLFVFRGVLQL